MKFSVIAIGEVEPDSLSTEIQRYMETDYSHWAIVVDHENGLPPEVFEAVSPIFRKTTLKEATDESVIRHQFDFDLTRDQQFFAYGWLIGSLGKEYSWTQYAGYFTKFARWLVNNKDSKFVCIEAVADFVRDCCNIRDGRLEECDFLMFKEFAEVLTEFTRKQA